MRNFNWYSIIGLAIIVLVLFQLTACGTVAGMGSDIKGAAEWTHDKMNTPAKSEPVKQDPAK
jgi:predicted small secreted protein